MRFYDDSRKFPRADETEKVLYTISVGGFWTAREISSSTGIDVKHVEASLRNLLGRRAIYQANSNPTTYRVTRKAR